MTLAVNLAQLASSGALSADSSGNVGIGTTSPSYKLQVQMPSSGIGVGFRYLGGTNNPGLFFSTNESTTVSTIDASGSNSGILAFNTSGTERARIDSSGNLLVGGSAQTNTAKVESFFNGASLNGFVSNDTASASGSTFYMCSINGTNIGTIARVGTTSSVAYNTSSDYRLKENVQPMTDALAKVAALKPVTYTWKADGSDGEGFIAHELAEVCPHAVTGEKDAVNEDGKPVYQGIDTSFLVATLTAAIQELKAQVDAQAAEIAALKGAQ